MSKLSKHRTLREFGRIYKESQVSNQDLDLISIPDKEFNALKKFIFDNADSSDFALSYFIKNHKETIRVNNYVGVIETNAGFVIEILPKIYQEDHPENIRRIFIQMLRYLKHSPFKSINPAHLNTKKFPVFEIFITAFLDELDTLMKKGLKKFYTEQEENLNCLKGRIIFSKHIQKNLIHKERMYVQYDEFSVDIPQNRILKSAIAYLLGRSVLYKNRIRLNQYLQLWESIPVSFNLERDFNCINGHNRLYQHYDKSIQWAKVFLKGESFTNFNGKSLNTAILFPMERIFEDYVAAMFAKFNPHNYKIKKQDRRNHLVESHINKPKFLLKPDIVIENKGIPLAILDTKWKQIDQNKPDKNYLISQSDMYQLYAYGKKYENNPALFLIYPRTEQFETLDAFIYEEKNLVLEAVSFDLSLNQERIKEQIESFNFNKFDFEEI